MAAQEPDNTKDAIDISLLEDLKPNIKNELPEESKEAEHPKKEDLDPNMNSRELHKLESETTAIVHTNVHEWFGRHGWNENPFTFSISPNLFVGYENQTKRIISIIEEKHKISLIVGPTGSGKTTLLRWVSEHLPEGFDFIFISKPPEKSTEFVEIFNEKYKKPWILRPFFPNIKNIYQIADFLKNKLGNKHLIIMFDEAHESNIDVLEWLRVLGDQVDHVLIILSGLPVFEQIISDKLETLRKRIVEKIELISLTKEETSDLLKKRIESVGGKDLMPFTEEALNIIYEQTGGFPREIIRLSNDLMNKAIENNAENITPDLMIVKEEAKKIPKQVSLGILEDMTPLQERVINLLSHKPMSPGQIADTFNLDKYKTRQHAVRSINNILIRLKEDGFLDRQRKGRAFIYSLSPKIRTLVVKS